MQIQDFPHPSDKRVLLLDVCAMRIYYRTLTHKTWDKNFERAHRLGNSGSMMAIGINDARCKTADSVNIPIFTCGIFKFASLAGTRSASSDPFH